MHGIWCIYSKHIIFNLNINKLSKHRLLNWLSISYDICHRVWRIFEVFVITMNNVSEQSIWFCQNISKFINNMRQVKINYILGIFGVVNLIHFIIDTYQFALKKNKLKFKLFSFFLVREIACNADKHFGVVYYFQQMKTFRSKGIDINQNLLFPSFFCSHQNGSCALLSIC